MRPYANGRDARLSTNRKPRPPPPGLLLLAQVKHQPLSESLMGSPCVWPAQDRRQGTIMKAPQRLRGSGHQAAKFRRAVLSSSPLCAHCLAKGVVRLAEEADHIVPLFKGGSNDPHQNGQALCRPCHDAKTRQDLGHRQRIAYGPDGWPLDTEGGVGKSS